LFSESIDDVGDLVLDLGEAYYDIGETLFRSIFFFSMFWS